MPQRRPRRPSRKIIICDWAWMLSRGCEAGGRFALLQEDLVAGVQIALTGGSYPGHHVHVGIVRRQRRASGFGGRSAISHLRTGRRRRHELFTTLRVFVPPRRKT